MMDFIFVGAPASFHHGEAAVKFVLDCLLVLPVKSCSVLANQVFFNPLWKLTKNIHVLFEVEGYFSCIRKPHIPVFIACAFALFQMFLEPLGQVVGQSKSKTLLLQSCMTESQVSQLQKLGCMLGVAEWTDSIQARCRPSHASLEEVDPEIADEFFRDDPEVLIA